MKEAELYVPTASGKVKCTACARHCQVGEGQIGLCGIRQNIGGKLQLLSYGKLFTGHIDPIEKKPVSHYKPGSRIFSVATSGCSWLCKYCFDPNTFIVTSRGLLTIEQLFQSSNLVQSSDTTEVSQPDNVNTITHKGRLRKIEAVFKHHYKGEMVSIVPYYLPGFKCTPNHHILATTNPNSEPTMVSADKLSPSHYLAIPRAQVETPENLIDMKDALLESISSVRRRTNQSNSRQLRADVAADLQRKIPAGQIALMHSISRSTAYSIARRYTRDGEEAFVEGYSMHNRNEIGEIIKLAGAKHRGVPRRLKLEEGLACLLGIYCAEGSVVDSPNRVNSSVLIFSFGKHEIDLIERTRSLIQRLFLESPIRVTQDSVTRLQIGNSTLAKAFKGLAGSNCYDKKVPASILLSAEETVIRAFVSGYLAGDGYQTDVQKAGYLVIGSTSVSKILSYGIAYCILKLRSVPRIYAASGAKTVSLMGRTVNRSTDYLVRFLAESCSFDENSVEWEELPNLARSTEDFVLIPVRRIERLRYDGPVYNMQVAEDHTYTASFFAVSNCQNYDISQRRKIEGFDIEPIQVPRLAVAQDCQGIAYTYNEPSIFIEFARDIGLEAHKKNLFNIFVSNGYDTPESVAMMSQFLDCITVDFKGSGKTEFVRQYIGIPNSEPIFETLLELKKKTKIHIEITDLIVPKVGDDLAEAKKLSRWVYENLGPDTPIHFLRFHPDYKMMDFPSTPVKTLEKHHGVAKDEGLKYAYVGNVPGHPLEHTYCPSCSNIVVQRYGFEIRGWFLDRDNNCKFCSYPIAIEGSLAKSASEERFLPAYF